MHRIRGWLICSLGVVGLAAAACSTTYTEADLAEEEEKLNAAADAEEAYDRGIAEVGGMGAVMLEQSEDEEITDSER